MDLQRDLYLSFEEYLKIAETKRAEYIDGRVFLQASPTFEHQNIIGNLYIKLMEFFKEKGCIPIVSPFDVILEREREKNVVQPDLTVICDKENITSSGFKGVPELVIEVLSPTTASKDYIIKMNLYMRYGVKEYWIVNPKSKTIEIFTLNEEGFYDMPLTYSVNDVANSQIFKELKVELKEIFF